MTPRDALKEAAPIDPGARLPTGVVLEPARGGKAAKAPAPSVPFRSGPSPEPLTQIHGEPSYTLANRDVEIAVTRRGGHLAPVRFRLGKRWVQPYALAPWQPDGIDAGMLPLLKVLRGDFFCLPFGGGKGIPVHGDTANAGWELAQEGSGRLMLDMQAKNPECQVRKILSIKEGQRAVYQEHRIEGLQGRFNFGHHAILLFPEAGECHVNVSPFHFASVKPEAFSNPLNREYGALKTGARFAALDKVPLATGGTTDLTRYPARQGFEDLVLMASNPGDFAWTAATLDGYVWISLKDPRVLPSTLFWISNGGRHGEPWNGRHLRRLGLEEICGHYSDGLETSRKDLLKAQGVPTTAHFRAKEAKSIRVIHLVHPVPRGFGRVEEVERSSSGTEITVRSAQGRVKVPVDWTYLHG
jgi:hypothetical protein